MILLSISPLSPINRPPKLLSPFGATPTEIVSIIIRIGYAISLPAVLYEIDETTVSPLAVEKYVVSTIFLRYTFISENLVNCTLVISCQTKKRRPDINTCLEA